MQTANGPTAPSRHIAAATALLLAGLVALAGCGDDTDAVAEAGDHGDAIAVDGGPADAAPPAADAPDGASPMADGDPGDAASAVSGPAAGYLSTTIDGPDDTRLPLAIWYPADPSARDDSNPITYRAVLPGGAYIRAPLAAGGPFPLILFSHGSQAVKEQSFSITEAWAEAGYIVAAPDHVGNTLFDEGQGFTRAEIALRRPRDLGAALGAMLAFSADPAHPLAGAVDAARVGVSGHSFGGYTTLVAAGASVGLAEARENCAAAAEPSFVCELLDGLPDDTRAERPPELAVLKAAVAMSPAGSTAFGASGFARVTAPTLILSGTIDSLTEAHIEATPIYEFLPAPKALALVDGGGHYSFANLCDVPNIDQIDEFFAEQCDPEAYVVPAVGMPMAIHLSLAWFDAYLRDDVAALDSATQAAVDARWPGQIALQREIKPD